MPPFDLLRSPDQAVAYGDGSRWPLARFAEGHFEGKGISLRAVPADGTVPLTLHTTQPLMYILVRWVERVPEGLRYVCDTRTSTPGDLEWRGLVPDRAMPWYFLAHDGQHTHGVGVMAGGGAIPEWHVDPFGVTLWLDVRSGGNPLEPGNRELHLADVVVRAGKVWEMPFEAARRFAAQLHGPSLLPEQCVYGFVRDGGPASLTRVSVLAQARMASDLAENTVNRPFFVVGSGWQSSSGHHMGGTAGMVPAAAVGDMASLAHEIGELGCRPGLWIRPWYSTHPDHVPLVLRSGPGDAAGSGGVLDPTHPDTLDMIRRDVAVARSWGFSMIRHDHSTLDLIGRWGAPSSAPHPVPWYDLRVTTAEVLRTLYRTIHEAAGDDTLISACGSAGRLAAGHAHVQRASSHLGVRTWEQVRSVGINGLAFRGFQQGLLYAVEAGSVYLSDATPWALSEQWLRLLAGSGTPCFVSARHTALNEAEQAAVRAAFTRASRPTPVAEPMDWLVSTCPARWQMGKDIVSFDWFSGQYASGEGPARQ